MPVACRIRFYMQMNAREAMHLSELPTSPQGHPAYRWACQEMLRRIAGDAGHRVIAGAKWFADMSGPAGLERLAAERRKAERLATMTGASAGRPPG